jgi:hypothetical protein
MRTRHAIALAALAASGCTWGPEIWVTSLDPATVYRDESVIVTIRGEGFAPEVLLDFDDPARSSACGAYGVVLQSAGVAPVDLLDAVRMSEQELRARLPRGLAKDRTWDVVVVAPGGRTATLAGGLRVANCAEGAPCDDGNPCTADASGLDYCTGASGCTSVTSLANGTSCTVECTSGALVSGTCQSQVCVLTQACPVPVNSCEEG